MRVHKETRINNDHILISYNLTCYMYRSIVVAPRITGDTTELLHVVHI